MGRILIADDHDSLRRGLARALADAGHEVEEAGNGNAALERLHETSFDVIVSDIRMGGRRWLRRAAHHQGDASDDRRHPDDGVRLDPDGGRGDEDRRLRLRDEAVRDRGDGGQDREGPGAPAPSPRDRVPASHAERHLRLRPHRRRQRRAAAGARRRPQGRAEQLHGAGAGRDGHRQGDHRGRRPPQLAARQPRTSSR